MYIICFCDWKRNFTCLIFTNPAKLAKMLILSHRLLLLGKICKISTFCSKTRTLGDEENLHPGEGVEAHAPQGGEHHPHRDQGHDLAPGPTVTSHLSTGTSAREVREVPV
jgi:hypothetical protein